MKLTEIAQTKKRLETETGSAILYPNGSMYLNNSGYVQRLTPEQVQVAWKKGSKKIPFSAQQLKDIHADFGNDLNADEEKAMKNIIVQGAAQWLSKYGFWDFGEEMHEIPSKENFRIK